jgi:hypothetical protein
MNAGIVPDIAAGAQRSVMMTIGLLRKTMAPLQFNSALKRLGNCSP